MKIFEVLPLIPMMLMTGLSVSPRTEKPPGQPMTNTEDYVRYILVYFRRYLYRIIFNNSHVEEKLLANYINEIFVQSFEKDIYEKELVKSENIERQILFGRNCEK